MIPQVKELAAIKVKQDISPFYHVILLNDEEHTYDYVIEMLGEVFGHSPEVAYQMALKVDNEQFVIVYTTNKEEAEMKRDLIESYGADWRMPECVGSMYATIEPDRD